LCACDDGSQIALEVARSVEMTFFRFLRSAPGRILRIATGVALVATGFSHEALGGVLLVMIGLVPVVSGIMNISVVEDLVMALRRDLTPSLDTTPTLMRGGPAGSNLWQRHT
jgi:hypothetical protein